MYRHIVLLNLEFMYSMKNFFFNIYNTYPPKPYIKKKN